MLKILITGIICLAPYLAFANNIHKEGDIMHGRASWYGNGHKGTKTANGGRFDPDKYTAAHRTLPFGTLVKITNLKNGKDVVVCITDRGPFNKRRHIDVSRAAAKDLDMMKSGVSPVRMRVLSLP